VGQIVRKRASLMLLTLIAGGGNLTAQKGQLRFRSDKVPRSVKVISRTGQPERGKGVLVGSERSVSKVAGK